MSLCLLTAAHELQRFSQSSETLLPQFDLTMTHRASCDVRSMGLSQPVDAAQGYWAVGQ